jgi:hypothetical protein
MLEMCGVILGVAQKMSSGFLKPQGSPAHQAADVVESEQHEQKQQEGQP